MSMSKAVRVALIVLLLTLSSDIAAALTPGNVSSIRTTQWPPVVSEGRTIGLAVIAGLPLLIQSDGAWTLKKDGSGWSRSEWGLPAGSPPIRGVISDGVQAYVFLSAGERQAGISRVARLEFEGPVLRLRALSPLPVTL